METKSWKWFKIEDLFDVELTKGDIKADRVDSGTIPLISSGETNNGIVRYIDEKGDGIAEVFNSNTITLDMFCHAYYQPDKYYAVGHGRVNILKPKFDMNKYCALYLCLLIDKENYRFSYGRAVYSSVAENIRIKLPVDIHDNPDWGRIENYVKERLIPRLPQKSKSVWLKQFNIKSINKEKIQLNTREWQWFKIDNVFAVVAGKYHYPAEYMSGSTPYLSATAVNNGVGNNIDLAAEFNGGAITTEKVGCTTFYQPMPFCATSDVNILRRKDQKPINKYVGLFLSSVIDFNEGYRWNYGRQCRVNDTKAIKIKLPAIKNANGEYEPDWQFMEDYIKSLPYSACL